MSRYKVIACTAVLNRCTFCGSIAELSQRSDEDCQVAAKAVTCTNSGDNDPTGDPCPLFMPDETFWRATKREAIEYWQERTVRGASLFNEIDRLQKRDRIARSYIERIVGMMRKWRGIADSCSRKAADAENINPLPEMEAILIEAMLADMGDLEAAELAGEFANVRLSDQTSAVTKVQPQ